MRVDSLDKEILRNEEGWCEVRTALRVGVVDELAQDAGCNVLDGCRLADTALIIDKCQHLFKFLDILSPLKE